MQVFLYVNKIIIFCVYNLFFIPIYSVLPTHGMGETGQMKWMGGGGVHRPQLFSYSNCARLACLNNVCLFVCTRLQLMFVQLAQTSLLSQFKRL